MSEATSPDWEDIDRRGTGRPGEVGRWSVCSSCHDTLVTPGETECPECRAMDGPYFGMSKSLGDP